MPTLHFKDHTIKQVPYDTAAKIREIQNGEREADNPAQAKYVAAVSHIIFEPIKRPQALRTTHMPESDPEMDAILADTSLKGMARFHAVGVRLRERNK